MISEKLRVLILDDEESLRDPLKRYLQNNYDYFVDSTASGAEALNLIKDVNGDYDVALIDQLLMPAPDGIEVMKQIRHDYPDIECIILTGWGIEHRQRALEAGAFRYLEKPFDNEELAMLIRTAAQQVRLRKISRAILSELDLDQVLGSIAAAARSLASADDADIVLINPHSGKMELRAKTYTDNRRWQRHFKDRTLDENIMRSGKPFSTPDIHEEANVHPAFIASGLRSFTGVPIPGERGNQGVLYVYSRKAGHFDAWTEALLQTLAGQAGLAITNAKAFEAEARRRAEAEALRQATYALTTDFSQESLFDNILEELRKVVPFDSASVQLLKEDQFEIIAGCGFPDAEALLGFTFPRDANNPDQEIINTRQPMILADAPKVYPSMGEGPHAAQRIRGWMGIPMLVGDEIIGMLALDKHEPNFYSSEHALLAQSFATQAAVTIENEQLYRQTRLAQERLRAFYEASNALVTSEDPEHILQETVERARTAAQAYGASLLLIDKTDHVRKVITAGVDREVDLKSTIREHGISRMVMATLRPEVIENVQQAAERVNPTLIQRGIRSALCLPVTLEGKGIGVMWVRYDEPRSFSAQEIEAVQLYVNQAALAYESARRIKVLEHTRQAAEALAGAADLREVLLQIVVGAREVLQADSAAIWSYDDVRDQFVLDQSVASGIPPQVWKTFLEDEPRLGRTAYSVMDYGWVGVTDVSDTEHYGFLGTSTQELLRQVDIQSFQGIRLTVGEEQLGVLYVNYTHQRSFSSEEQQIAKTFANHAALALKKARLLEQVNRAWNAAKVVAEVSVLEDLSHTLEAIADGTLTALSCDAVTLYTYNEDKDQFGFPPTFVGVRNQAVVLAPGRVKDSSVVRNIIELDEPHVAEYAELDDIMQGPFVQQEDIKSSIGIPLQVAQRKVGVMFVNYRAHHRFTVEELTNIELFANQAAVAIHNAWLLENYTRHTLQLQTVADVSKSTGTILELEALMDHAVNLICKAFEFYYVGLFLVDEAHGYAVLRAGSHEAGRRMLAAGHKLEIGGQSMIGWCVAHAEPRIASDVGEEAVHFDNPHLPDTRSEMALPLISRGQCIGALTVQSTEAAAFTAEDRAVLQTMADQLAIAVDNAQRYEAEQRRVQELAGLYNISQTIRSLTDIEEVYQRINDSMAALLKVEMSAILLYDASRKALVCQLPMYGVADEIAGHYCLPIDATSLASLWMPEQSLIFNDVAHNPRTDVLGLSMLAVQAGVRDTLLAKMTISNRDIGIVQVSNKVSGESFDDDDARLLNILAGQAAAVIENARLYEEVNRRAQVLQTLYQAGKAVTGSLALDEILNRIAEQAWKLMNRRGSLGGFSNLALIEDHKLRAIGAYPRECLADLQEILGNIDLEHDPQIGVMGRAVRKECSQRVDDVEQDVDYISFDVESRSELAVPIKLNGHVIGIINVEHPLVGAFTEDDQRALEYLASQAAIAIQNARAYEDLKQANEELEKAQGLIEARTAVAWMGMASSTWRHSIDKHALTIREQTELLRMDLEQGEPHPKADKMYQRLERIERLASQIIDKPITLPLSSEAGTTSVPLNALIRERTRQLQQNNQYQIAHFDLDLQLREVATVWGSPEWLRTAFEHLVDNAVNAVKEREVRDITIRTREVNGFAEVSISDTGAGIPEEIQSKIGIGSIKKPEDAKGMGMGLLLAQTIVQTYSGEIYVDRTGPNGTTMIIRLPLET